MRSKLSQASALELAQRKQLILARSAALRGALIDASQPLRSALAVWGGLRGLALWAGQHPVLVVAAATALSVLAWRGRWWRGAGLAARWVLKGYTLWQIWRRLVLSPGVRVR